MVEVCGKKNWEIIIAVITGEPGFFIFYFKNNNRRVKMERSGVRGASALSLAVFAPRRLRALIFSFSKHARVNFSCLGMLCLFCSGCFCSEKQTTLLIISSVSQKRAIHLSVLVPHLTKAKQNVSFYLYWNFKTVRCVGFKSAWKLHLGLWIVLNEVCASANT